MADDDQQRVELSRQSTESLANEIGSAVDVDTDSLESRLEQIQESLETELSSTRNSIETVRDEIETLEERIATIERTKARAQKQAAADVKEEFQATYEQKREQYESRIETVIHEYADRVSELKDRLLGGITVDESAFEQVSDEYDDVASQHAAVREHGLGDDGQRADTYSARAETLTSAQDELADAIDDLNDHRDQTASTLQSLQTSIPGVSGSETVTVPFWVIGYETNGTEHVEVLPVQTTTTPSTPATDEEPYREFLQDHPDYQFGELEDAVAEYAQRDDVWESLSEQDRSFADPDTLPDDAVADPFEELLRTRALADRQTAGAEVSSDD